jgi:hypothetical protein
MTTTQLDVNTCDKVRGLHKYSLVSGNLHALLLELLVNCATSILEFTYRRKYQLHVLYLKAKVFYEM